MSFYEHTPVRTCQVLSTDAFFGAKQNKVLRKPDTPGYVVGNVPQSRDRHPNKAYLVQHDKDPCPAIYLELELTHEPAYWRVTHMMDGAPYGKEVGSYDEAQEWVESLKDSGVEGALVEGPFYSTKELVEGPMSGKSLFDHLTDDNL
jgi:hypothetical protein